MKLSDLDKKTISYIEYLAEEKGQKAIDKYYKYVSEYEVQPGKFKKYPMDFLINRAKYQAHHTKWKA